MEKSAADTSLLPRESDCGQPLARGGHAFRDQRRHRRRGARPHARVLVPAAAFLGDGRHRPRAHSRRRGHRHGPAPYARSVPERQSWTQVGPRGDRHSAACGARLRLPRHLPRAAELEPERLAQARHAQFRSLPWRGPVNAALAGEDLQHSKHYAPYAEGAGAILAKAQTLAQLRAPAPRTEKRVEAWLARSGVEAQSVLHLPLRGRNAWVSVLIDRRTAQPVKLLLAERV